MDTLAIARPEKREYIPYYEKYVGLVSHSNILAGLASQIDATLNLLNTISDDQSLYRYAPGKWSIKENVGHMIDTERIFGYRALRIARGDKTPLPGFEQDDYVRIAGSDRRSWPSLKDELEVARKSTIALFGSLEHEAWLREGVANNDVISVRALAYIIAGHELHHIHLLRSKYLSQ